MRRLWGSEFTEAKSLIDRRYIINLLSHYPVTEIRLGGYRISFLPVLKIIKMRLKGKTLKFKKVNIATFYLKFGKTHPIFAFDMFNSFLKKRSKQKFFLYGYSKINLIETFKSFSYWKPYNIYHWRGVRRFPAIMVRKDGKVSEYFK